MTGGVTRHILPHLPGVPHLHVNRYAKTGNKKRATCFATLLQNELNSDVARFTTHIKPVLQKIKLLTGLNMGGKMRNNAIRLVLQQCCKTLIPAPTPTPLFTNTQFKLFFVSYGNS